MDVTHVTYLCWGYGGHEVKECDGQLSFALQLKRCMDETWCMMHDEGQMGSVIDYKDTRVWLTSTRGSVDPANLLIVFLGGAVGQRRVPGSAHHVPYLIG